MKTKTIALLLAAALLLTLAGCGAPKAPAGTETAPPARTEPEESAGAEPLPAGEASFPLLAASASQAESEAMVNHNVRACARLAVNYYYCRCDFADGSRALVRYEIVDGVPRSRRVLVPDCPAEFLCESGGRLYYLNADALPESVSVDGDGRRAEYGEPCLSLQCRGGALYCLRTDGTLLLLREGGAETLLSGCAWAFASEAGIFYTAASDGRLHLFDAAARTDTVLTAEAAFAPTLIGSTLYYAVSAPGGRQLCALDLTDGERRRGEESFTGDPEFFLDWDGGWQLRLTDAGGQRTLALSGAFDGAAEGRSEGGAARRLRGLDDVLHTDELLSSGGSLGFELVMPGGGSFRSLASDNPPEP